MNNKHNLEPVGEGIASCQVCHSGGGALTLECPGKPMTEAQQDGVFRQTLEYFNGKWWVPQEHFSLAVKALKQRVAQCQKDGDITCSECLADSCIAKDFMGTIKEAT